jgi:hypothetical protein
MTVSLTFLVTARPYNTYMKSTHGLRTTGRPTGNFGRAKVQAKRDTLDLTKEILTKDNLRIPDPNEAYTKLVTAYNQTTDPRLKAGLWELLKRRKATLQPIEVKPNERPSSPYWENVRRVR